MLPDPLKSYTLNKANQMRIPTVIITGIGTTRNAHTTDRNRIMMIIIINVTDFTVLTNQKINTMVVLQS